MRRLIRQDLTAMKPFVSAILTLLLTVFMPSWAYNAKSDENSVDIRGTIVKVNRIGNLGTFLVKGSKPRGTEYKASVIVTEKTLILKKVNRTEQKSSFEELEEGLQVEVKFTGPVRMTYPVQAQAGKILIIE
jgi:hypothetical protein